MEFLGIWIIPIVAFVLLVISTLIFLASRYKRCPSDQILVVYCEHGPRAAFARFVLRQRGFTQVQTLRDADIRLIGPNCLGIIDTVSGFNTNFDIGSYPSGGISILTQSGAFGVSFLSWAGYEGLVGLNKFVSIGNMADINMAELLTYWKDDDSTRVIGIYMEGLSSPAGFFEVAREVAAVKPIVVLKSGRSAWSGRRGRCDL